MKALIRILWWIIKNNHSKEVEMYLLIRDNLKWKVFKDGEFIENVEPYDPLKNYGYLKPPNK